MRKLLLTFLVFVTTMSVSATQTGAQAPNLLQNPGMENPYVGQGASDQTAPNGWRLWFTGIPVTSFPHIDIYQIHAGAASWNIRKGEAVFTAGGWQQVAGIRIGSTIRATVFAQSYTCNDRVHSCIGGDGKHHSDPSAGAIVKVGVDPSGGTDPNSGQIVWSSPVSALDAWTQLSIDAINCNTTVTFFMYTTQSVGMFINSVYFDDASLSLLKEGDPTAPATCGAAPGGVSGTPVPGATIVPTAPALAPFVKKQGDSEQPDGSIVHTVVAGDTLAGIGVAYGVTLDELRQLNNIKPGDNYLKIGQKIIVRGPTSSVATAVPSGTLPAQPTIGAVVAVPTVATVSVQPTLGPVAGVVTATPLTNPPISPVTAILQLPAATRARLVTGGLVVAAAVVFSVWRR